MVFDEDRRLWVGEGFEKVRGRNSRSAGHESRDLASRNAWNLPEASRNA
jgi:hypothetical protein